MSYRRIADFDDVCDHFDRQWTILERDFLVDGLGGAQYRRIFSWWIRQIRADVREFILNARLDTSPSSVTELPDSSAEKRGNP